MNLVTCKCCDNVKFSWMEYKPIRCNDWVKPLPLWKRLVQIAIGVHRDNCRSGDKHQVSAWKVTILSKLLGIKQQADESAWRWVNTKKS